MPRREVASLSRVAVIGTFHRRPERIPAIVEALGAQTRIPDDVWLMCDREDEAVYDALLDFADVATGWVPPHRRDPAFDFWPEPLVVPLTPPAGVIPYSWRINVALEQQGPGDYILYLTDDSLPHPRKIELMAAALDDHPDWGQVYCGQDRNGSIHNPGTVIQDPWCVLDHTQVMHRYTEDRWPLELDKIKLGDAHFWMALRARQGPFYPVPEVLDAIRQTPDGISAS